MTSDVKKSFGYSQQAATTAHTYINSTSSIQDKIKKFGMWFQDPQT
jgi:hypothetical protein